MAFFLPHYQPLAVVSSIAIATLAAYAALELAKRVSNDGSRIARNWRIGGALALGTGIWSMHFVGMLAFSLPIQLGYTHLFTLASWLAAVGASAVALGIASASSLGKRRLLLGSATMGAGIFAMHYLGMAAIDMAPGIVWNAWLVAASLAIAVGASAVALLIFFWMRRISDRRSRLAQLLAAAFMGVAISGMHYTGMAAASFPVNSICLSAGSLSGYGIDTLIAVSALLLLAITLLAALFDARLQTRNARTAATLRQANLLLDAERERFSALTALSSDWFWEQDEHYRLTHISSGFHGYIKPSEYLGKTRWELGWGGLDEAAWQAHRDVHDRRETFRDFELTRLDASGRMNWVSVSGAPVFDAAGTFTGYRGVGRNITQQKLLERRQRMQHDVTRLITDAATAREAVAGIVRSICLSCGWEGGVYRPRRADAAAGDAERCDFWAAPDDEFTFARLAEPMPADRIDTLAAAAGLLHRFECELRVGEHRFGTIDFRFRTVVSTEETTFEAIRMIGMQVAQYLARDEAEADVRHERQLLAERVAERTNDLTEANRRLEVAKLEAEDANRAKSSFLATMSHEIRTPMNGVIGMVEVLAESGLAEDQADAVRTIRASGFTLLSLIDDILDFSKIEAGHLELEHMPVSLNELVEEVRHTLAVQAAAKAVELRVVVAPEVPERVETDPMRLRQVLYNLVGNAIKFSAGRALRPGRVSVRIEVARPAPLALWISVTDNGIGIAPETMKSLFTPFTQAEASTTRRFGGTGLGLAISKRLVDLMGGTIEVQSDPDNGSVFRVLLPVKPIATAAAHGNPDVKATPTLPHPVADHSPRKVRTAPTIADARAQGSLMLVAEDDEVNQKVILRQLALLGYAAEVAGNGAEALRLWREGGHALLLSDLHMPELDGYALTRTIRDEERALPGAPRMPILALTANALHDEASRVRAAGMDEYLTKPIQLRALSAALERWMPRGEHHDTSKLPVPQAPAKPTSLPVDVEVLKSLVGDDMATVREFLSEFLVAAREQAAEIVASCDADDSRRVGAVAHKLKASSRAVGALALGDLCAELENACRAGGKAELAERRVRFEASMREVQSCIVGVLAELV